MWDELLERCGGEVVGKCKSCSKSQVKMDTKCQVVEAEAMGMEDTLTDTDVPQVEEAVMVPKNNWCCMYWVISLQEDFANKKPLLQHYLEGQGHVCMFLPKFHESDQDGLGICQVP